MNPETETENDDAFQCPPLPADLQAQTDGLLSRRAALFNLEPNSDEIGDLMLEAERIQRDWRECCERQWRSEKSAALMPTVVSPSAGLTASPKPGAIGSSQQESHPKMTALAEYQALKAREAKGEIPAGSAFAFWRENRGKIQDENQMQDSAYDTFRTAGGALIRRLKK